MSKQATCAERVQANKEMRIDDLKASLKIDSEAEGGREELQERVLCVDVEKHLKIHLSTGGPGDWFELVYGKDDKLIRGEYHFQDWFDHAEVALTNEEAKLVEEVYVIDPSYMLSNE